MIVPLVSEETWLAVLQKSAAWTPPAKPTLVVSPHPDDETLGAGGLIASQALRNLPVTVVAVTDGEAAYVACDGLAATRRSEQANAVRQLGAGNSIVRLGLPDSALTNHQQRLEELLSPSIHPGMLVLAPWINDWHPDHEACARATHNVCQQKGAELISYVFWTWHRRTADVFAESHLLRLELSAELRTSKMAALKCHVSQLQHDSQEPILPASLLLPAYRSFETYISHV